MGKKLVKWEVIVASKKRWGVIRKKTSYTYIYLFIYLYTADLTKKKKKIIIIIIIIIIIKIKIYIRGITRMVGDDWVGTTRV